ncbi:MAG: hypothetical protein ACLRS1_07090 [Oscillospiraceae bacterium]
MTPEKQEVLWEKLVELKETPGKDGEAPEKRGEPFSSIKILSTLSYIVVSYIRNMFLLQTNHTTRRME